MTLIDLFNRTRFDLGDGLSFEDSGDQGAVLTLDVPGARAEDVTLQITGRILRINAKTRRGPDERVLYLADRLDGVRASATVRDGVLRVALPWRDELKPRRIPVVPG